MFIEDKKDKVFIPQTQNTITANDYNQIKNEIQNAIELAGMTPEKDVIQLPEALKTLTQQSGAEEVAKIEAAGQEQLDAVNSAGNTQTSAVNSAGEAQISDIADAVSAGIEQINATGIEGKVAKAGDTMTGALKVPTADFSSADTTAINREWAEKKEKTRISNCLTKIPQDIKLELSSDGTLTLKSGSKVYSGAGSAINITQDISGTRTSPQTCFVFVNGNSLFFCPKELCFSGDTEPIVTQPFNVWYDTANKEVKYTQDTGVSWTGNMSLPVCITTSTGGKIASIDKVFNGFGYIGKTLFALPGVEGLLPNGRNADGTLNNTTLKPASMLTLSFTGQTKSVFGLTASSLFSSTNAVYDSLNNRNYNPITGNILGFCKCGDLETDSSGSIVSFSKKPAFHAVDYYDILFFNKKNKDELIGFPNLSAKVSINSGYTAPSNGWVFIVSSNSSGNTEMKFDNQQVYFQGGVGSASSAACGFIPIKKGQIVTITGVTSVKVFMPML